LLVAAACPPGTLLQAQPGTLAGPVAGFVYDGAAHALRPIQGVPGASVLGEPVSFGLDMAAAYVAPRQDYVFAVGGDNSLHLFRLTSGAVTEVGLNGVSFVPERVVFSPSGTSAALIVSGKAQVFTGLPTAPALAGALELNSPRVAAITPNHGTLQVRISGPPVLALSDDGTYLLNITAGSVWLLSINGQKRPLMAAESRALTAFAPGTHDAALLDRTGVTLIRDAAGTAAQQVLAPADDNLVSTVGLAFSADGRTIYAASTAAPGVLSFDVASGNRTTAPCDCVPSELVAMNGLFRLNEPGGPLWLLDTGVSGPRVVFVPAVQAAQ